jgi:hypothetical protein
VLLDGETMQYLSNPKQLFQARSEVVLGQFLTPTRCQTISIKCFHQNKRNQCFRKKSFKTGSQRAFEDVSIPSWILSWILLIPSVYTQDMKVKVLIDKCNLSAAIMTISQWDFFFTFSFPSAVLPSVTLGISRMA